MDGLFVPNITLGPIIIKAIRPHTRILIDAHLMIEEPGRYLEDFIKAGSDMVTVHAECYGKRKASCKAADQYPKEVDSIDAEKARKDLKRIKELGAKTAMAINPGTPLCIQDILDELDMVLIMSVNPGFSGQKFMASVIEKVRELREIYSGDIEVDGGINDITGKLVVDAGANILATASYFFKAGDGKEAVEKLKNLK
jgi:ribulose-phosphate 3-epimerase